MLVQEGSTPKSPKSQIRDRNRPTLHPNRFSEAKSLDFSTWVSENLYKIFTVLLLIATVAALFFLRNVGDTASLLCFETQSKNLEKIEFPQVNWNAIAPVTDKSSPYANFRTKQWIVVSVSNYPSDSLRNLVKIRGWQVLAIGNSKTPSDWGLKGAIFLSLEQQASLGFRVVDFLPYDSYVRKTVGYLFAIQHGAKKIFDADDRGDVIDGDIGKHFDVVLVGEGARREVILQYSHDNPNRTVVNPYIHFGQRSIWPRGLPLENVGEVEHEEYYTEVFGGKQFIQQGISNGLPDVDSMFYFTRKSGLEALDIRFDEHAPKVAFPQGIMVPVNSFNTIYHSAAFWGLMLPVSISSMASDVLRGYWGQRLLWEIGGYVVVYPPTVHRNDRTEAYPFSEEKDLHVNVGRLIKFLVSWRSNEHRFFEKILQLSFAMAEEGFWTDKDVKFTAAWLQDLLAVGYRQPRLMSLELDMPRASIGQGDRKEFIPQKLPSVHLGVEETGTVNYEIANLIRWRKTFGNVVLILYCSGPVERTALEWRLLYGRVFKTVIILSGQKNPDLAVEEGQLEQLYKHLPKIFERYTSAEGFLFLQDDTILNYWNLVQADKTKLWITNKVSESWTTVSASDNSDWFSKQADFVKKVVSTMPADFQVSYKESITNVQSIGICSSEVFYIPRRFVADFVDLVNLVGSLEIHQKVAVPMFFVSMDSPQNFDPVLDTTIYKGKPPTNDSSTLYSAQVPAVHPWNVSSEQDFIKLIRIMAEGDPLLMELV
ncbi:probable glycosyltransferase STELLO1 [Juglans microcarpa x Juglans regia]|uniref:probable glycosyltransferase STELLO1 n=1 Tax=Juglans microcarpa x Juglans regia TaxID=2249226 RepID=UPI001B7DD2A9|nr:probable glycosyltransferase STELLO1 [Juglans microcarpa x Juglans regia]